MTWRTREPSSGNTLDSSWVTPTQTGRPQSQTTKTEKRTSSTLIRLMAPGTIAQCSVETCCSVFSVIEVSAYISSLCYHYGISHPFTDSLIHRGSVYLLQDVPLCISSPVVSLSGISAPSDSFHLHDVVSPSLHLSTS